MQILEKRRATTVPAGAALEMTGASEGNQLMAQYATVGVSAMDLATAFISRRWRLPAPTARVVVELACLGGRS